MRSERGSGIGPYKGINYVLFNLKVLSFYHFAHWNFLLIYILKVLCLDSSVHLLC